MKQLIQTMTAAVVAIAFIGVGNVTVAKAQSLPNCDEIVITNTGPDSYNEGVCEVDVDVKVICENDIYVLNENSQSAVTGAAEVIGNVTSGTAISGDAVNENETVVEIGAACESDDEPVVPGKGAVTPPGGGGGAGNFAPTALPVTSEGSIAPFALIGLTAAAAIALAAKRFGATIYRQFQQ